MKILFFFIFLLFLSSCGSLKRTPNIISVDSHPRGVNVYNEKKEYLGKTPFFARIRPAKTRIFSFRPDLQSSKVYKMKYKCDINVNQSLFPAMLLFPFVPVGTIAGGSFILIDYISGALFSCKRPLFWKFESFSKNSRKKRKILVLPIHEKDEILSNEIFHSWHKNIFQKFNENGDKILNYEKTKEDLNAMGISNFLDGDLERFQRGDLNILGEKYNMTHVLRFEFNKKGRRFIYTPKLYDAFSLKNIHENNNRKSYLKNWVIKKKLETDLWWDVFIDMINILPNAFLISYSTLTAIENSNPAIEANSYSSQFMDHPRALPRYLKAFGIFNVNHPQYFKPWDVSIGFYPTFSMSSWRQEVKYDSRSFMYDMYTLNIFYDVQLSFQTPFGSPNISLGTGLIDLIGKVDGDRNFHRLTTATKLDIDYVIFFSQRYFMKFNVATFAPNLKAFNYNFYNLKSWSEFTFSFGYYFPELKTIIRKVFN